MGAYPEIGTRAPGTVWPGPAARARARGHAWRDATLLLCCASLQRRLAAVIYRRTGLFAPSLHFPTPVRGVRVGLAAERAHGHRHRAGLFGSTTKRTPEANEPPCSRQETR
ncbi:hypothetical protein HPB50_015394 [Hyalomma asiaticum]|uniref:Uncharacterized protein n=1 Tax=Hyalomma asiaticum TaxID=266040 RepID=A0ACB7TKG4_HYAAI|nr:hypothetical protein HPB50_015394 [Hyalomma asiaticum]